MAWDVGYEDLKSLAREKRVEHQITTSHFGLREMRRVYAAEGIHLHLWPHKLRKIRALYLVDEGTPHVLLNKAMPKEPKLFSLAHELKHHFVDHDKLQEGLLGCREYESSRGVPIIEIGAEVFAAELIFPEAEFRSWVDGSLRGRCTSEDVVQLKRDCPAIVSYIFLVKRLERLGYVARGTFEGVKFVKLEEQMFGVPFYKRSRRSGTTRKKDKT